MGLKCFQMKVLGQIGVMGTMSVLRKRRLFSFSIPFQVQHLESHEQLTSTPISFHYPILTSECQKPNIWMFIRGKVVWPPWLFPH